MDITNKNLDYDIHIFVIALVDPYTLGWKKFFITNFMLVLINPNYSPENGVQVYAALKTSFSRLLFISIRPPF